MDRNLANYLFHNETLYTFQESNPAEVLPQEKQIVSTVSNLEEVTSPLKSTLQTAEVRLKSPAEFAMKTKYLIVAKALSEDQKDFLLKVLEALSLNLTKVDLLDTDHYPEVSFRDLIYNHTVQAILFFGEESGGDFLPKLKLNRYEVKDLKGVKFLYADNLTIIGNNQDNEKRKLWECLKAVF
jgi:hypothetical protein